MGINSLEQRRKIDIQEGARGGSQGGSDLWVGGKKGIHACTHHLDLSWEVENVKRVEARGRRREKNSREYEDVNMCKPDGRLKSIRSTFGSGDSND